MRPFLSLLALAALVSAPAAEAQKRAFPYFASIRASKARMRTGPGRNYPASWLYVRPDLPVRVLASYKEWRKVEDPGGTTGWMQGNLLADDRTAIVLSSEATLHAAPEAGAKLLYRAAPGVVGRLSKCARGWCLFDVHGRVGYVEANRLWGVEPNEAVP